MQSQVCIERRGNLVEVMDSQTHQCLAWCFIGDDGNIERIADSLSVKRLGAAAQELRELARQDRLQANRKPLGVEVSLPAGIGTPKKPAQKAQWRKAIFG